MILDRLHKMFPNIPVIFPGPPTGFPIIASVLGQPYDPELLAIDPNGLAISRGRLGAGYGTPPVVPYGQTVRKKLLGTFPVLNNFPRLKKAMGT